MKFIKRLWYRFLYNYFYGFAEKMEIKKMSKKYPDYMELLKQGKIIGDLEQIVSFDGRGIQGSDFDICYDREKKIYMLSLETAFIGPEGSERSWEVPYLKESLKKFTDYMNDKGLNTEDRPTLFMSQLNLSMIAETIEELYINFRVFVYGFIKVNELIDKKMKKEIVT